MKIKEIEIITIMIKKRYLTISMLLFTAVAGLAGCKKADNYYQKLRQEPEFYSNRPYDAVFGVGDTLTMYGRFVANDLRIKIGDADAVILEKKNMRGTSTYNNDSIQVVKVLISPAMGAGPDRQINIMAGGITINTPAIEIVADRNASVLKTGLTVQRLANYPVGYLPVYCRSGNGNMYFINTTAVSLIRIDATGTRTQLSFDATKLKDNDGNPFTVNRINGYGIDPEERYLYLSLYQQASTGTLWHYYRLCRYDLVNGTFTVLNKTPYHISKNMNTDAAVKPFEGNIQNVKMFNATAIFPGKGGKVYFKINNQAITYLDASGNYSFRFKNVADHALTDQAPQIYDDATGNYKKSEYVRSILPGKEISFQYVQALDPENNYLYTKNDNYMLINDFPQNALHIQQYNLTKQSVGSILDKVLLPSWSNKPYSVGSFNILNYSAGDNGNFGLMPLLNGQLVILKYQDIANTADYKNLNLPQWAVVDFEKKLGQLYAPGMFDRKTYVMNPSADVMLNYDAQGMLYMTASNQTTLLKTIFK